MEYTQGGTTHVWTAPVKLKLTVVCPKEIEKNNAIKMKIPNRNRVVYVLSIVKKLVSQQNCLLQNEVTQR
jgi:hypothetical protein